MVVGNGMIAKRFGDYAEDDSFLLFASGVSNSVLNDPAAFARERDLLLESIKTYPQKNVVYFSTCSIYDPSMKKSPYVLHKLEMEKMIKTAGGHYTIFRVSNPIGKTENPNTVLNYFVDHVRQKKDFTVWRFASRNLIDLDHIYLICNFILKNKLFRNHKINIANPVNYSVLDIVQTIEKHFGIKAKYQLADKGNSPLIDTSVIQPVLSKLKINFDNSYLPAILQKYFPVE